MKPPKWLLELEPCSSGVEFLHKQKSVLSAYTNLNGADHFVWLLSKLPIRIKYKARVLRALVRCLSDWLPCNWSARVRVALDKQEACVEQLEIYESGCLTRWHAARQTEHGHEENYWRRQYRTASQIQESFSTLAFMHEPDIMFAIARCILVIDEMADGPMQQYVDQMICATIRESIPFKEFLRASKEVEVS